MTSMQSSAHIAPMTTFWFLSRKYVLMTAFDLLYLADTLPGRIEHTVYEDFSDQSRMNVLQR